VTSEEVPKDTPFGRVCRGIGEKPLTAGLIGGLAVVSLAAILKPGGVANAPWVAAQLAAIVIFVWVVLIYMIRGFFQELGMEETHRMYEITRFGPEDAPSAITWTRNNEVLKLLEDPATRLFHEPGLEVVDTSKVSGDEVDDFMEGRTQESSGGPDTKEPNDRATVWIVTFGADDQELVVQTRVTAGEAVNYDEADRVPASVDEELPIHVVRDWIQQIG
jgi:hypothetical protein